MLGGPAGLWRGLTPAGTPHWQIALGGEVPRRGGHPAGDGSLPAAEVSHSNAPLVTHWLSILPP